MVEPETKGKSPWFFVAFAAGGLLIWLLIVYGPDLIKSHGELLSRWFYYGFMSVIGIAGLIALFMIAKNAKNIIVWTWEKAVSLWNYLRSAPAVLAETKPIKDISRIVWNFKKVVVAMATLFVLSMVVMFSSAAFIYYYQSQS